MAASSSNSAGAVDALDLASEAVWALMWARLGADAAAKHALASTCRAFRDVALASWKDVRVEVVGASVRQAIDQAAFVNRLRSNNITLTCAGPSTRPAPLQIEGLHAFLAALEAGGAAERLTALTAAGPACWPRSSLLQPFSRLATFSWCTAADTDPADLAAGLAALPPSLKSLDLTVKLANPSHLRSKVAAAAACTAALQAIGAAASSGGLAGLQCLTAGVEGNWRWNSGGAAGRTELLGLRHLTALTALRELSLPSACIRLGEGDSLQPLSQLPALQALSLASAFCGVWVLAALAPLRPWTRLMFDYLAPGYGEDMDVRESFGGDWELPQLRALHLVQPGMDYRSMHIMHELALRCPALAEFLIQGEPRQVFLNLQPSLYATAAQLPAALRKLQLLHDRHLLSTLAVAGGVDLADGRDEATPQAVLAEAAAEAGLQALPGVEHLHLAAEGFTDQHLSWLLGLLPNVRTLWLRYGSGNLTGAGVSVALQRHMQQPGGRRFSRLHLHGYLTGISWEDVCSWAAALPAGRQEPLEVLLDEAKFGSEREAVTPQAIQSLMLELGSAGRGNVVVTIR